MVDARNQTSPGVLGWAERWLSADRLAPYLSACGGDCERALELYEWNISLGQVLMRGVNLVNRRATDT